MKDPNFVSIIICGYNAEKFIAKAIESVLRQTHSAFELILIDDGSTDGTHEVMEKYKKSDNRIKVISHLNKGMADSVNEAVLTANSDIIFRLDADDVMYVQRVEKQLEFLTNHNELGGISCLGEYLDENDRVIGKTYSDITSIEDCKRYLKKNEIMGFLHPGFVFRRQMFLEVEGYNGTFWPAEDVDLCNKFIERGYWIITIPEVLVGYRIHSSSVITSKFMESRRKYEWLRACIRARRLGLPQPTKEEFSELQKQKGVFFKINNARKNFSKFHYRNAGFEYAKKNYLNFLFKLGLSFLLQPKLVVKKLIVQTTR